MQPLYGTFVPGESPFRVKGTIYQAFVRHMEADVAGGMASVRAELDEAARRFYEQPFLASSRYDILPLIDAGQVGARLAGSSYRAFVRDGGVRQAVENLTGVYRVMLRLASPRLAVDRASRIFMQYLDFGAIEGSLSERNRFEAVLTGIPRPVCPWIQSALEGFAPKVLEYSGGRDASVVVHPFERASMISEMPIMTARVTMKWND